MFKKPIVWEGDHCFIPYVADMKTNAEVNLPEDIADRLVQEGRGRNLTAEEKRRSPSWVRYAKAKGIPYDELERPVLPTVERPATPQITEEGAQ